MTHLGSGREGCVNVPTSKCSNVIRPDLDDFSHYTYAEWLWDEDQSHKLIFNTIATCTRVRDLATHTPVRPSCWRR
jgi:hypothetical protein